MRVVRAPQQEVRIGEDRVADRDAAQAVFGRPGQPGPLPHQGGEFRVRGQRVQHGLGAGARPARADSQAEGRGHLVVVRGPLGPGGEARYPDRVAGELGRRHRPGFRERMAGAGQQLVGLVQDPRRPHSAGQFPRRGDGPERGVDLSRGHRRDRGARVEEGHDVEFGLRPRAVKVAQHGTRTDPPADDVDAKRGPLDRRRYPFGGMEKFAGVGKHRPARRGQLGTPRCPGKQAYAEFPLKPRYPFGHRLLRHPEVIGGGLELSGADDRDERAHGEEVHSTRA